MLRAEHYSSAPGLQPWWWAASSAPGLLSPSLRSARSDANTPVVRSSREGATLYLLLRGRFPVELVPSLRCRWVWGGLVQDTEPGVVVGADGNVLSLADAEVGDTLQCELPDWRYGATARASAPPVLAVVSDTLVGTLQHLRSAPSAGPACRVPAWLPLQLSS
mgnify:CR=1 FL=1|jgi:hypothetical protein